MLLLQLEKTTHNSPTDMCATQWGRAILLYIISNNTEVPGTKKIPHCVVKFEAGEEQNREVGKISFKKSRHLLVCLVGLLRVQIVKETAPRKYSSTVRVTHSATVHASVASHQVSAPGGPLREQVWTALWSWPPDVTTKGQDQCLGVPVCWSARYHG